MFNFSNRPPMRSESYKRFDPYKNKIKSSPVLSFFFNWLVKGFLVGILISINFLLFASSANYSLFAEGASIFPHIICPILWIFVISITFMFLISFSITLENVFVAFIATIVTYATINQFTTLSSESFLYSMVYNKLPSNLANLFINNSDILVSIGVGFVTLILLLHLSNKMIMYVFFLFSLIFGGVLLDEYINQDNKKEFVTLHENKNEAKDVEGRKFVYIMLPSATSYNYISDMQKEGIAVNELEDLKNIMLGFYVKNKFKLYANAYVEEDDMFINIANQFNIVSPKKEEPSILNNVLIDGYMKFKNRNEKHIYLESNKLFNDFKNANYQLNIYQTHGIELCHSNNELVADKCVEKQNTPFNFQDMDISEAEKTRLLIIQWIDSTALFNNLSLFYNVINVMTDANKIALVGIPYKNLQVINSIKTLDIIMNDMLKESGDTTFFALIDAPGEMYVYNEFCEIKPKSEWLHKNNLAWVKGSNNLAKKKAYVEQTKCVYGKLQEFIDLVKEVELENNTVIVIQGISGADYSYSDDYITNFISKKSVTMAIKEPNSSFNIINDFCPTTSFLNEYLLNDKKCDNLNSLKISDKIKNNMIEAIEENKLTKNDLINPYIEYNKWYEKWKKRNEYKDVDIINHLNLQKHIREEAIKKEVELQKIEDKKIEITESFEIPTIIELKSEITDSQKYMIEETSPEDIEKESPEEVNDLEENAIDFDPQPDFIVEDNQDEFLYFDIKEIL